MFSRPRIGENIKCGDHYLVYIKADLNGDDVLKAKSLEELRERGVVNPPTYARIAIAGYREL